MAMALEPGGAKADLHRAICHSPVGEKFVALQHQFAYRNCLSLLGST
jgi:hypothetical protein